MSSDADPLLNLKKTIEGLEYPSESDSPFDLFQWPPSPQPQDQQLTARAKGRKITQVPIDQFFSDLNDSEDAPRFTQLRRALETSLKNLHIYRVGEGETTVDIYLIGQTPTGACAGVHTQSIET